MPKSDDYREMQISSGQLAAVILSLLALCVLIFYLGIRVGSKRADEEAATAALKAQARTTAPVNILPEAPKPTPPVLPADNAAAPASAPAETTTPATETQMPAADLKPESGPENKPATAIVSPAGETKIKAAETKPAAKTETKAETKNESKPAAAEAKPKTAPAKTKTVTAPSGTYYIQAGAIDTRAGAETYARKIEALGFRAIVLNPFAADKKTLYRVRVGPYETKEAAAAGKAKLAAALKKKSGDFFVVKG